MRITSIHPWNLAPKEAVVLQRELAVKLFQSPIQLSKVHLIAGIDVSSSRFSSLLTAGVIVWNKDTGEMVDSAFL